METNQPNEEGSSNNRKIKVVIFVILLFLPILFLIIKFKGTSDVPANQANVNKSNAIDITALENLVKTNPTVDNLVNLSNAYISSQMPGKSVEYSLKAIELNPKSVVAYNNLGVAYTLIQQYQNGIDACTKALQIDSTFQLAKNNLAWAKEEKNNILAAIKKEEQTPEKTRDVAFYRVYGMNYFKIGDYNKSIEIWNKTFDLDPKNVDALNNIGTAFMMKAQVDDAIAIFKKAVEVNHGDQLAKNNLAWALDEKSKVSRREEKK